ncbi:LysM peptidoglycan-binding domain-containing protein [Bradyrhizobium sp. cf659]|uniref:LysM peptidoglycan-binding domain-containing protein n=1 Tax=Bradyrhizobium sp. cf659 TaxID=1761771 RepID=UPI0008ED5F8A|nr:LysM domain-containing protein [Bradyrhizobium sp. cf659]SFH98727.1 hypothetical protein SAMN04487925_1011415 [Bradyrhizobium sp. cf659]
MSAALTQVPPMSAQGTMFGPTSRYFGLATTSLQTRDGQTVIYLTRRFVPQPGQFALLQTHRVVQGERLDNIAAQFLGDPEAFWRLCDANNAMRPNELTETIGRQLRITLPQGVPQS